VKPGQKLCTGCYKKDYDLQLQHDDINISDDDFLHKHTSLDSLSRSAEALDCTPIKTSVGMRDRPSYGKRKIKQHSTVFKAKCAHVLDLSVGDLETTDSDNDKTSCSDLDKLMLLVKDKIKVATKQEKIRLLTLVPESWSKCKTMQEFDVTEHLVKRARTLKKEKGILADLDTKRGKSLSQSVVERVVDFYQSDEYSRMCPGKKEYVTIKVHGNKVCKQKRLILINLKELYLEYTKKHVQDKIGFSKFCEIRPKWCLPVTASGMHSVCVCEHHQNVKLLTAAMPANEDYKQMMEKIVCSTENRNCMLHLCESCPGKHAIEVYLTDLFASQDFDSDDPIHYKQWVHTDRTSLVSLTVSTHEFIQLASDALDGLRQHHFIAKAQSSYLTKLKEDLSPDEAIVLLDFAENYSFIIQDAVQGHHWDNSQATLHPFVIYYISEDQLKCLNVCIISDCLKHDTITVHAFISAMVSHLKATLPSMNKIIYFSDGAASQYKNYKNFSNLCYHKSDHGLDAEWNFFATSHGKSPCDGIGGTVKRLVARASLQATVDNHILTAIQMFNWASEHIDGVKFLFVSADDVTDNSVHFDLPSRFASATTVTGTRSHHSFIPVCEVEMTMKRISADSEFTVVTFGENQSQLTSLPHHNDQLQPGQYVACIYDKEWFVGCIAERSDDESDVLINFMKHASTGLLSWPPASRKDQCWVPFQHVICLIDAPELQGHGARSYKLSMKDKEKIHQKLPAHL
jgi:hypothetical protein